MATTTRPPSKWAHVLERPHEQPDAETRYVAVGYGWDAVVVTPLARGLAALDRLSLPSAAGHGVLADFIRHDLVVLVAARTAAGACTEVQGMRALGRGSWLLVPAPGSPGALSARWLSTPNRPDPRPVAAAQLAAAVHAADSARSRHTPLGGCR